MKRDIVTRREILKLIAARTRSGQTTSFRTLVWKLDLSKESACEYLKRLWRERLLRSLDRATGFGFRLGPGESLRELHFKIHKRGLMRLEWWRLEAKREKEGEEWFS